MTAPVRISKVSHLIKLHKLFLTGCIVKLYQNLCTTLHCAYICAQITNHGGRGGGPS